MIFNVMSNSGATAGGISLGPTSKLIVVRAAEVKGKGNMDFPARTDRSWYERELEIQGVHMDLSSSVAENYELVRDSQ